MRVKLYGGLQKLAPPGLEGIDFQVENVKQCVEAFSFQCPGFQRERPVVQIKGVENEHDVLRTDLDVLHIMPAFIGGKRGGFLQILIGAVLIAASYFVPGGFLIGKVALSTILFNAGLSLALSGVLALMAPKPPSSTPFQGDNTEGSKYLAAQGNTTRIGTRIPIGYGRQKVYGHILSYNVTAAESDEDIVSEQPGGTAPTNAVQSSLALSQSNVIFPPGSGFDSIVTLNAATNGASPYTYSATNLSNFITFDPSNRRLTSLGGLAGGRIIDYTVTDADGAEVTVRVPVSYDNTL